MLMTKQNHNFRVFLQMLKMQINMLLVHKTFIYLFVYLFYVVVYLFVYLIN